MKGVFADNLKAERKNKGFTQTTISQQLKVDVKRYAAWEEGRSTPNLSHLTTVCEILSIDDLYLFISKKLA